MQFIMCYVVNVIIGCVYSVISSIIDVILLDYNGISIVLINFEQFGCIVDVMDFINVIKVSLMKMLVILIIFF